MPNYVGCHYELFGNVTAFRCTINKCCSRVPARGQRDFYRFTEAGLWRIYGGFGGILVGSLRDSYGIFAGSLQDSCWLSRDRTGFSRDFHGIVGAI